VVRGSVYVRTSWRGKPRYVGSLRQIIAMVLRNGVTNAARALSIVSARPVSEVRNMLGILMEVAPLAEFGARVIGRIVDALRKGKETVHVRELFEDLVDAVSMYEDVDEEPSTEWVNRMHRHALTVVREVRKVLSSAS